jgi:hypothetical protein
VPDPISKKKANLVPGALTNGRVRAIIVTERSFFNFFLPPPADFLGHFQRFLGKSMLFIGVVQLMLFMEICNLGRHGQHDLVLYVGGWYRFSELNLSQLGWRSC